MPWSVLRIDIPTKKYTSQVESLPTGGLSAGQQWQQKN
jgi:hypothetical protein